MFTRQRLLMSSLMNSRRHRMQARITRRLHWPSCANHEGRQLGGRIDRRRRAALAHSVGAPWHAVCSVMLCMPDMLAALVAFVDEHQRCGELDGGRDNGCVWLACSCGAEIVQTASEPPKAPAEGSSRN